MASFVLIPGAMHGRWTWDRIVPRLEVAGHTAIAPDLPGMGTNQSIPVEDVTLADWGDFVAGVVREAAAPVVLAGHSRGGLVIGEAAERVPDLIAGLIYVTALLVPMELPGTAQPSCTKRDERKTCCVHAGALAMGIFRPPLGVPSPFARKTFFLIHYSYGSPYF